MVIKEISQIWMNDKVKYVKQSSFSSYALLLITHIYPYFGEKEQFTEKDVQEFVMKKIEEGYSIATIKHIVVVIKMIQRFAVKNKLMNHEPIDVVYPLSTKGKELQVLTKSEERKLLDYLNSHFSFKNLGLIIALSTGLRIGELCALKWCDFDMEQEILKVRHTVRRAYYVSENERHTRVEIDSPKTISSNRDIPLSTELCRIIKPLLKVVNPTNFVLSNDAKPIEPRNYRNYFKRLVTKIDIPYLKFHGLRHSFATRCIESDCDYKTVSAVLGHANVSTTMNLYVHPNNEQKKKCIEKMLKSIK